MKSMRLARKLGLDGNPLHRRTDKIAVGLAAMLVAVFLIGAPWLAVVAVGWAGRAARTGQEASPFSHRVLAVLLQTARVPATSAEAVLGYSLVRPGGSHRTDRSAQAISRSAPIWLLATQSRCGSTWRAPRAGLHRIPGP